MSLPVVEVICAPATEAFRANPRSLPLVAPTFDILKKVDGQIRSYYGLQHEDSSLAYTLVAWESLGHHHELMNDEVAYPPLVDVIQKIIDPFKLKMFHCAFTSEPYKALQAPVTELATFTLNPGQSKDALEGLVEDLSQAMNAAPRDSGVVHAAWGPTIEHDDMVALFVGWTSIEAHWNLVKTDQTIVNLVNNLRNISTIKVVHIPMSYYP
ncbi:hypothetical protein L226DRAFT_510337 [Lentinus tigrinus ALCF2SS1-7]|uniref:ABM domain-containing protein n=1 Tax=Lentinus tigrinus ALCF2SS1-6 TaxID=1328759 RepID=A0A5C2S5V9_9APHY|nr:hypothetical protein L227DRAFT_576401 [Lentinus tigrinus ALCF2SS1-6]RPD73508.1 hypothetical protein L226DRAFT_510337 [Lentinus tigrinus ALCF2SS1-7]